MFVFVIVGVGDAVCVLVGVGVGKGKVYVTVVSQVILYKIKVVADTGTVIVEPVVEFKKLPIPK